MRGQYGKSNSYNPQESFALGYVYRATEEVIHSVRATSSGYLSEGTIARGLAELLLAKAGGEWVGNPQRVYAMRKKTSKVGRNMEQKKVGANSSASRPSRSTKVKSQWTKKRRREYSLRMKRLQNKLQAARGLKAA